MGGYCTYLLPKQALETLSKQQKQNIVTDWMKTAVPHLNIPEGPSPGQHCLYVAEPPPGRLPHDEALLLVHRAHEFEHEVVADHPGPGWQFNRIEK